MKWRTHSMMDSTFFYYIVLVSVLLGGSSFYALTLYGTGVHLPTKLLSSRCAIVGL
jgi:hypothetical protein